MKLPKLSLNKKTQDKDYYLSIVLRNEKISAISFEETAGIVSVLGEGNETFSEDIETATEQELLEKLDKAISVAEGSLPENITTHKTIFGLKETWIEAGKIKKDYLAKLKKICDELELKPVGFLVVAEAVAHLLASEEGAPITAILAEVGKKSVNVSLIKAGRLIETKATQLHENAPFTVDTLLKHFQSTEILPSRIILLDSASEELSQEFIGFSWSKSLPFLHLPQVGTLASDFDAKAVLAGAAIQMGFKLPSAVNNFFGETSEAIEPIEMIDKKPVEGGEEIVGGSTAVRETSSTDEEFGFVANEDVAKEEAEKTPLISDNLRLDQETAEIPEQQLRQAEQKQLPINAAFIMTGLRKVVSSIKKVNFAGTLKNAPAFIRSGRIKIMAIPGVLILILLVILFIYLFKTSATITLAITPKDNSKNQSASFSTTDTTNISTGVIAADTTSVSEDGKLSQKATGKKQTGDKPKGIVTLYNNSDSTQTVSGGTKITSSNNLDFTLDKSVSVASQSGDSFSGTKPGTTDVAVTASTFGTDYNLPSGTKYSVGSSSTIVAKNDNAFSGGTTKTTTVVSKDDQSNLATDLTKKLTDQAKTDISKKLASDTLLIPIFLKISFDTKSYSNDVGDETSDVALTATINFVGITYKQSDLYDFAKSKLDQEESGLTVNPENFSVEVTNAKLKGTDSVSATLAIKASLIPKINKDNISKEIEGKSPTEAQAILEKLPLVNHADVSVFPSFPLLPERVPPASRIKIVINTNG